jgi:glutamate-1-semialdehyde 2,1-aminomutase
MLERRFLASTLFYAMYAHQRSHVESYLEAVNEVFADIAKLTKKGKIEKHLRGKPANAGFGRLT